MHTKRKMKSLDKDQIYSVHAIRNKSIEFNFKKNFNNNNNLIIKCEPIFINN